MACDFASQYDMENVKQDVKDVNDNFVRKEDFEAVSYKLDNLMKDASNLC